LLLLVVALSERRGSAVNNYGVVSGWLGLLY